MNSDTEFVLSIQKLCKSWGDNINDNPSFDFPDKNGIYNICTSCGDSMKYLKLDVTRCEDKVKFTRKVRCNSCNFYLCKINNEQECLWCLGGRKKQNHLKYPLRFGKYKEKTGAFVLQNDFSYCKFISELTDGVGNSHLASTTRQLIINKK